MKKIVIISLLICTLFITGCSNKKVDLLGVDFDIKENEGKIDYDTENPVVAMNIEDYGAIIMELYPDKASNTVNNFISLVKSGFYDNNSFHRYVADFVLQGGDPDGNGTGGPGYFIKGEFSSNGFEQNDLKHKKKVVSMARSSSPDSAGSQFFIVLGNADSLDGDYAAFGKVVKGWNVIEEIENNETISDPQTGKLTNNLVIKKAIVDTKGKTYDEVEKIEDN